MKPALLPTRDAPDDDPRLWLEEVEGETALAWADRESAATLARFGGPFFERDRDDLAAILDRPDRIPFVARRGGLLYNLWQDEAHPRGLWRRTTLESYRSGRTDWELLLDLDALAEQEGEDWIWSSSVIEPVHHERAIIRLSRGGADAAVHREFDLTSLGFVADGFTLPEAKGSASWLDRDTLLLSSAFGAGMATDSGYARTVRLWQRGEDPGAARVLFEVDAASMMAFGQVDRTEGGERLWFLEKPVFFESLGWIGDRDGPIERLDLPADSWWQAVGDWLVVKPRQDWSFPGRVFAADSLLGMSLSAFRSGRRDFAILFEPAPRRSLERFFWNAGELVVSILDNLEPRFLVLTPGDAVWSERTLDTLPTTGTVDLWSLDSAPEETNGELLAAVQDPVTPLRLLHLDLALQPASPALLKAGPSAFRADGLVVTRHEAVSVDGERIPYTQTGPAEGDDGDAPVHMTAYGGFGLALKPSYGAAIGKLWLERGGTSVVANIRGGGEFGSLWHEAGRRAGKHLAHEDFAAVAADLVRRGVTRPRRIAAEGGSNGGLLIANMLTRHPERFGALLCTIPLIDMRRYAKLLAGASWIDEYGDPDKPEDWAFIQDISAYHNVEAGRPYPPIMIATTRRDDRVHPGHARKMAAKLMELGYDARFYEPPAGGHGYGKDNRERATFIALGYRFLRTAIGWEGDCAS